MNGDASVELLIVLSERLQEEIVLLSYQPIHKCGKYEASNK